MAVAAEAAAAAAPNAREDTGFSALLGRAHRDAGGAHVPILVVVADGIDVMSELQRVAAVHGPSSGIKHVSACLPVEADVQEAVDRGRWIAVHDIHLATPKSLSDLVSRLATFTPASSDPRARVWITTRTIPPELAELCQRVSLMPSGGAGLRALFAAHLARGSGVRRLWDSAVSQSPHGKAPLVVGDRNRVRWLAFSVALIHSLLVERCHLGPPPLWAVPPLFAESDAAALVDAASMPNATPTSIRWICEKLAHGAQIVDRWDLLALRAAVRRALPDTPEESLISIPSWESGERELGDYVAALPPRDTADQLGITPAARSARGWRETEMLTRRLLRQPESSIDMPADPRKTAAMVAQAEQNAKAIQGVLEAVVATTVDTLGRLDGADLVQLVVRAEARDIIALATKGQKKTNTVEDIVSLSRNVVPLSWSDSQMSCQEWAEHLRVRADAVSENLDVVNIGLWSQPRSLLTALLMRSALLQSISLVDATLEASVVDSSKRIPRGAVMLDGLWLEGGRFDKDLGKVVVPGNGHESPSVFWRMPRVAIWAASGRGGLLGKEYVAKGGLVYVPLYASKRGEDECICVLPLKADEGQDYWVERGIALMVENPREDSVLIG